MRVEARSTATALLPVEENALNAPEATVAHEDSKTPSSWPLSPAVFAWVKVREFSTCEALTAEQKGRWRAAVEAYASSWSRMTVALFYVLAAYVVLSGLGALGAVWFIPLRITQILLPLEVGEVIVGVPWRLGALGGALVVLVVVPSLAARLHLVSARGTKGWVMWSVLVAVACALLTWHEVRVSAVAVPAYLTVLLAPCVLAASCWLFLLVNAGLAEWVDRRVARAMPQAHAALSLLDVLAEASREDAWRDVERRWKVAHKVEAAALALQRGLLSDATDARTNEWAQRAGTGVAHAMRRLKRSVLLPHEGSRAAFLTDITGLLEKVIEGRWGELPRVKPAPAPKRGWRKTLLAGVRLATSLLVPATVLWAARTHPALAALPGAPYLFIGCVAWIVLVLVSAVDPGLRDRVQFIKQLGALLAHRGGPADK